MRAYWEGLDPAPPRDVQPASLRAVQPAGVAPAEVAPAEGAHDEGALWSAVAASMEEQIAVLDADGTIVAVNEAWRRMAREGGLTSDLVGTSYLTPCDTAGDDPHAREAAASIRGVLAGTIGSADISSMARAMVCGSAAEPSSTTRT